MIDAKGPRAQKPDEVLMYRLVEHLRREARALGPQWAAYALERAARAERECMRAREEPK